MVDLDRVAAIRLRAGDWRWYLEVFAAGGWITLTVWPQEESAREMYMRAHLEWSGALP